MCFVYTSCTAYLKRKSRLGSGLSKVDGDIHMSDVWKVGAVVVAVCWRVGVNKASSGGGASVMGSVHYSSSWFSIGIRSGTLQQLQYV